MFILLCAGVSNSQPTAASVGEPETNHEFNNPPENETCQESNDALDYDSYDELNDESDDDSCEESQEQIQSSSGVIINYCAYITYISFITDI